MLNEALLHVTIRALKEMGRSGQFEEARLVGVRVDEEFGESGIISTVNQKQGNNLICFKLMLKIEAQRVRLLANHVLSSHGVLTDNRDPFSVDLQGVREEFK